MHTHPIQKRRAPVELREAEGGKRPVITGYAALYHSLSIDLGGYREVLLPGAFSQELIDSCDCRALVDHDPSKILGRTGAGTLRLSVDDRGLRVEIAPPDTSVGRDIIESLRRGDVTQMSFAFRPGAMSWTEGEDGEPICNVTSVVELLDVSCVTFPAYEETEVSVEVRTALESFRAERPKPNLDFATHSLKYLQAIA